MSTDLPAAVADDVQRLWEYHHMRHELRRVDVIIGLGSHDLGVADHAARLYYDEIAPLVVFSGANAPTTVDRCPRGEAVHYRERALDLGVPDGAILVEPTATNTAENLTLTRDLLRARSIPTRSAVLVSRPYQQRRAYATCKKLWPELDVICSAQDLPLARYVDTIGDVDRVITMLVGDTQRIEVYANRGYAIPQPIPSDVRAAYEDLVAAGYTSRLI